MSINFSLCCVETKKCIWIGQGTSIWNEEDKIKNRPDLKIFMDTLYSGEPKTMEHLKDFLNQHRNMELVFLDDEECYNREYENFEGRLK